MPGSVQYAPNVRFIEDNREAFIEKNTFNAAVSGGRMSVTLFAPGYRPSANAVPANPASSAANVPIEQRIAYQPDPTAQYIRREEYDLVVAGKFKPVTDKNAIPMDMGEVKKSFADAGVVCFPRNMDRNTLKPLVEGDKKGTTWESKLPYDVNMLIGKEQYKATHRASDPDRLMQAWQEQSAFYKTHSARLDGQPVAHTYNDFASFEEECKTLTYGRDAFNTPMSQREELQRGWAMFNNAKNVNYEASLLNGGNNVIVFGRTDDTNHTGAGQAGYTSEYHNGAVLMPERWNYFVNDCWVMGGIKGGASFASTTSFEAISRDESDNRKSAKVPGSKQDCDFRSDYSEDIDQPLPLHYIMTVSIAELQGLEDCGYVAHEDDEFGVIYKPGPNTEELRNNYTFTQLRESEHKCRVSMASEAVGGNKENQLIDDLQAFMTPTSDKRTAAETNKMVADFSQKMKGDPVLDLPTSNPDNAVIRKGDNKICSAKQRIANANGDLAKIARAKREICNSAWFVANKHLNNNPALSNDDKQEIKSSLHLAILGGLKGGTNFPDSTATIRAFVDGRIQAKAAGTQPGADVTQVQTHLKQVEHSFADLVKTGGGLPNDQVKWTPDEHATLWPAYQQHACRVIAEGGNLPAGNAAFNEMADFVKHYEY